MTTTYATAEGQFTVELLFDDGPERKRLEQALIDGGTHLPLPHRTAWAGMPGMPAFWFVAVRSSTSDVLWGFALEVARSRAFPGHLLLRAERLRAPFVDGALRGALTMLSTHLRAHRRVLRASLEVLTPDPQERGRLSQAAADAGFRRQVRPRMYTETLVIDLRPSEPEIFASLHGTARRHIRAVSKRSLRVSPITDLTYAERMTSLSAETMARTGGDIRQVRWSNIIELSDRYPELSHIAGLFRTDTTGPNSLLAFAWGRHHGDHADYAAAASTRCTDIRIPLGYAPAWDLMCWARGYGATWFDFGGITLGRFGQGDPVGGISDFKRYFGGEVVAAGEEWVLEPSPLKAKIANTVSAGTSLVRKLLPHRI